MSTLRLPPDEFALVRKVAAMLQLADEPPRWPTPDELRSFLRENVTIVKPGETLVIRLAQSTSARQVADYARALTEAYECGMIPFRAVVIAGEGLGVVQADGVTHACPEPGGGLMPCCGQTPFEAPRTDRISLDPDLVTCGKAGSDG